MHAMLRGALWAGIGVAVSSGPCMAVDQAVNAVKLIVVDKGTSAKAVLVAKDPVIDKGPGTDATTIGAQIDIAYDNGVDAPITGQFVAPEGSSGWLVNKATVAKYVNKSAPTGGGAKVAIVKPGNLVKLVGKSTGDTPLDIMTQGGAAGGTATTAYRVTDSSTGFDTSFCSTFSGCVWKSIAGGSGAKLVCKGGVGDPTCSASVPPTTTTSTTLPPVTFEGVLPSTTGRFNYNLVLGLPGADARCNTLFPGSHACTYTELLAAESQGDLVGIQDVNATTVTSFWAIDSTHSPNLQCTVTIAWDYNTAHTGQFGELVQLNNGTGDLGPLQSGQPAGVFCLNSSWVGCCS